MRKGGGKAKGASFEREVCKRLSLWVSDGTQEDVFWRSAMSGGRSTLAAKAGKRLAAQAGDLSCIHPNGQPFLNRFMVECKFYNDLEIVGFLLGRGTLAGFWKIAKKDAATYSKHPLLIAKQNRLPTIALTDEVGISLLRPKKQLFQCRDAFALDLDEMLSTKCLTF